jgi:hypothetical protein
MAGRNSLLALWMTLCSVSLADSDARGASPPARLGGAADVSAVIER